MIRHHDAQDSFSAAQSTYLVDGKFVAQYLAPPARQLESRGGVNRGPETQFAAVLNPIPVSSVILLVLLIIALATLARSYREVHALRRVRDNYRSFVGSLRNNEVEGSPAELLIESKSGLRKLSM